MRLQERQVSKEDRDPKALASSGLLEPDRETMPLRFVEGRPLSHVTTAFLEWLSHPLERQGQQVLVLIWENASWHVSKEVRGWLQQHNRSALAAQRQGKEAVRIIACGLPVKSPWLNRIEPHWVPGKRAIVEPARLLTAQQVESRVCEYFGGQAIDHLAQKVA